MSINPKKVVAERDAILLTRAQLTRNQQTVTDVWTSPTYKDNDAYERLIMSLVPYVTEAHINVCEDKNVHPADEINKALDSATAPANRDALKLVQAFLTRDKVGIYHVLKRAANTPRELATALAWHYGYLLTALLEPGGEDPIARPVGVLDLRLTELDMVGEDS